jgi:hypothetical protein
MKTISFTIEGNHKGAGNAIPKLKMTQGQQWMPKAREYTAWKSFVVSRLFSALDEAKDFDTYNICSANQVRYGKPIALGKDECAILTIGFLWADAKHGDPENCLGSIADAIFWNDKNVDVATSSYFDSKKQGHIKINILIFENHKEKLKALTK